MNKNEKSSMFLIEKLDALEWDMKLLNTSVTITHTPLRTLMSMIKADVVLPSRELLRRVYP